MRVTDEMVDAAIAADSHASWWAGNNREGAEKRMRAALEAALEGTKVEPVAWTQPSCLSEVAVGNGGYIWGKRDMAEVREFIAATGGSNIPDDIPLYTTPPAGIREALEVIESFIAETVDYATRNNLGDPEKQHNVKWGRKVLAALRGQS